MDDAQVMRLAQPFCHLLGDGDGFPGGKPFRPPYQPLEILPGYILHRDEEGFAVLVELVHPADVAMVIRRASLISFRNRSAVRSSKAISGWRI